MLPAGMDVDIESGMPKAVAEKLRRERLKSEHEDVTFLSSLFRAELGSAPGKTLIAMILGKLIDRIETYLSQDVESRAYLGILDALDFKINVAPRIAEHTINKHLPLTH